MTSKDSLQIPETDRCAFCDYLHGVRPYTILRRGELTATLVTREQRRGVAHVLVLPIAHRPTLLDLTSAEASALMAELIRGARAIDEVEQRPGIAIWQNNGVPAHQAIPHVHFHVAGTLPGGGTEFGTVDELPLAETEHIAERLRPHLTDPHHDESPPPSPG